MESTDTDVNAGANIDADIDTVPDAIIISGQVRSGQVRSGQVISDQMDRTFSYSSVESAGVYRSEDITIA